jgi:hypothetical protein
VPEPGTHQDLTDRMLRLCLDTEERCREFERAAAVAAARGEPSDMLARAARAVAGVREAVGRVEACARRHEPPAP